MDPGSYVCEEDTKHLYPCLIAKVCELACRAKIAPEEALMRYCKRQRLYFTAARFCAYVAEITAVMQIPEEVREAA